jgi:FAD/FMN-containing dehydrogenase
MSSRAPAGPIGMRQRIGTAGYEGADNVEAAARMLRRTLHGRLHRPGDAAYDALRRPHAPALDPRPAIVVEALGAADVRAAVAAARDYGLRFAVQSTGHGTHVACDGGILVRTGAMAAVLVDPDRRVAHVGAGARWGDVLAAAAPFGLAPLSGSDPSVGVAGYTLGGGLGWLARRHGFAADSLLRAEVVTAEARVVRASADEHPDLHWALRGGGGGFGVVTAMEIALHPVDRVYAGTAYFAIDCAAETLARYRDWTVGVPDALSTAVVLTRLDGERALGLKVMHAGDPAEAERLLAPLRAAAGPALRDDLRVVRFPTPRWAARRRATSTCSRRSPTGRSARSSPRASTRPSRSATGAARSREAPARPGTARPCSRRSSTTPRPDSPRRSRRTPRAARS